MVAHYKIAYKFSLIHHINKKNMALQDTIYFTYTEAITTGKVAFFIHACNQAIIQVNQQLAQEKQHRKSVAKLYFMFNSNGGQVDAGIMLHNYLKSLPYEIIMHNISTIESIALPVFLAAQKRYAVPNATFLLHGVAAQINGSINKPQVLELLSRIENDEKKIESIISSNSLISEVELQEYFLHGKSVDAQFAVEKGIIQDIKQAQIPSPESWHLAIACPHIQ